MYPFIETIKLENGKIHNLSYHNDRMNETRRHFFGDVSELDLKDCINPESFQSRHRCRVEYAGNILKVEYFPYYIRPVTTLKLIVADDINYSYKSSDRTSINSLFALRGTQDDVLIVREGMLTDTSIANIALHKDGCWFTPVHPLLKGTKRKELLERGIIKEANIQADEIDDYTDIRLFNAMIGFGEISLPVGNVSNK